MIIVEEANNEEKEHYFNYNNFCIYIINNWMLYLYKVF